MLPNLLRATVRSFRHNRGFAVLNVAGLAIGLAAVVLIALFLRDELGFDRFHTNGDRIVRMDTDFVIEGEADLNTRTQGILAPALATSMPDV